EAWTKNGGDIERLKAYFHPAMVAITPTDREILEGRNECFESWRRFVQTAEIHHWNENQPSVRLFGDTAVVTYYFDMSFNSGGNTVNLGGRDMYVLIRENGRWWAVADQFSSYPAS
ncbi:MAG: nuclear transport factor 2 family protein, partial [Azoarcus sp.]|nr:nuclear transport factor 2 family protein [Azoarcus sp.]